MRQLHNIKRQEPSMTNLPDKLATMGRKTKNKSLTPLAPSPASIVKKRKRDDADGEGVDESQLVSGKPRHRFINALSHPTHWSERLKLMIYKGPNEMQQTIRLRFFNLKKNAPKLVAILDEHYGEGSKHMEDSLRYPPPKTDLKLPAYIDYKLFAHGIYKNDFISECGKYERGDEVTREQFFECLQVWAGYSISGSLRHDIKKGNIWMYIIIGQWLKAPGAFLMTLRAASPLPVNPKINMDIIIFFSRQEHDSKLTNPEQPKLMVLAAHLLEDDSILRKEIFRPNDYNHLLPDACTAPYNPKSLFHGPREYLASPAVYFHEFLDSVAGQALSNYTELSVMSKETLWDGLDSLCFYEWEGPYGHFNEDTSLARSDKAGLPFNVANVLLIAEGFGIRAENLLAFQGCQKRLLESYNESSGEDFESDVREASEGSGEEQPEEVGEDNLEAAFEEELETALEAALQADAAETSAIDNGAKEASSETSEEE